MIYDDKIIKKVLLDGSYVSKEDMDRVFKKTQAQHEPLIDGLFSESLITKDLFGQALAEEYGVPYADLNSHQPSKEQVLEIPEELGKKFRVVLFQEDESGADVTTDDPLQKNIKEEMEQCLGKPVRITFSLPEDIDVSHAHYRKALETRFSEMVSANKVMASSIINDILEDALTFHASDIHFEPFEHDVVIRFRIDGVMQEAGRIPQEYYENVLNRIKVQSRLRIDEHFAAQDGSMRVEVGGKMIDLRVSIVPTMDGEKAVMRLLSVYVKGFSAGDLGLSPRDEDILRAASKKPYGMILVVGPTGSGKTTTLYALLKNINRSEYNITTIEDPVEYKMEGINQIQVNQKANLTFASGLRSIVRQDPDVILVGEIRDEETAEIAVNAALTGHLLFSTFHANDAATAIPRLLDMNIEPFLVASTLQVIIAQRLARKICDHCKHSVVLDQAELAAKFSGAKKFFTKKKETVYQGSGCEVCNNTGYKGRTAFFELIQITPELQDLMIESPSAKQIWDLAKKQGAHSLFEDGVEKVKQGITTIDELLRVAAPPTNR